MYRIFMVEDDNGILDAVKNRAEKWDLQIFGVKNFRKISKCPILFLSSASDNMNMVMAMNMGGDDFVAKPFDIDVLIAKIQALLRRTYDYTENMSILEHREAFLNVENGVLTYHNISIDLTKNEHRILSA